jgi:agmatinase
MVDLKDMFGGGARGDTFLGLPQGDLAALVADVVLIGADCATPYASVGPIARAGRRRSGPVWRHIPAIPHG